MSGQKLFCIVILTIETIKCDNSNIETFDFLAVLRSRTRSQGVFGILFYFFIQNTGLNQENGSEKRDSLPDRTFFEKKLLE